MTFCQSLKGVLLAVAHAVQSARRSIVGAISSEDIKVDREDEACLILRDLTDERVVVCAEKRVGTRTAVPDTIGFQAIRRLALLKLLAERTGVARGGAGFERTRDQALCLFPACRAADGCSQVRLHVPTHSGMEPCRSIHTSA